ncbi:baseplate J/gp47 family protein [Serratia marcescens]|uniref:baseplate J/gp47 family protein n=1 Tax=Serratia marcescens TaxID=615 RepID=UPI0024C4A920|nr:baseplate J/gp47 family protein [Serratia marcescens]MDK1707008.1 baseplate J/gp47 family protein [Serratia marcescens]
MSGAIDLSQLPAPVIIEPLDFDTTLAERKQQLIALFPADQQAAVARTLSLPSDPSVKLLELSTYLENLLRQRVNEAAYANMLALATGSDLDNLAANFNVRRLVITPEDPTTTPVTPAVMETDTALRLRTQQAMEALSVAGPSEAYEYFARSADGRVADAKAISPSPACVTVAVLSSDGDGTASDDLLSIVTAALNDRDRRPIADRVTVQSVDIVNYQIDAVLILADGPQAEVVKAAAMTRLQSYIADRHRIGRDIHREKIVGVLNSDGIENIIINAPAVDIAIGNTQAAYCTAATVHTTHASDGGSSD